MWGHGGDGAGTAWGHRELSGDTGVLCGDTEGVGTTRGSREKHGGGTVRGRREMVGDTQNCLGTRGDCVGTRGARKHEGSVRGHEGILWGHRELCGDKGKKPRGL